MLDGSGDLPVLGLPGSVLLDLAARAGRAVWREGFPDRGYTVDGRLMPPRDARRAVEMARSGNVDSVCVHGDVRPV